MAAVPNGREPHLALRATDEGMRHAATVGCNRLVGPARTTTSGSTLEFKGADGNGVALFEAIHC